MNALRLHTLARAFGLISLGSLLAVPALAQGRDRYMNVEPPQVKPIAIGVFPSADPTPQMRRLMFVCNTPNDTVEIYNLGLENAPIEPVLLAEVLVGKAPVSVLPVEFDPGGLFGGQVTNAFLTANFLGDSVSYVGFGFLNINSQLFFETHPIGTIHVGDEPMDIALRSATPAVFDELEEEELVPAFPARAFVAKRTFSSYSILSLDFLNFKVMADVELKTAAGDLALKEPHRILMHPHRDELWILGHQGGNGHDVNYMAYRPSGASHGSGTVPGFDFDIARLRFDPVLGPEDPNPEIELIDGLGTTNFGMEFSVDGERLYVVGTRALGSGPNALEGNDALKGAPTGFTRTSIYRVDASVIGGVNPLIPGDLSGGPTVGWDANLEFGSIGSVVDPEDSLAHLTDLIVRESADDDVLYLAAFHSDNVAKVSIDKDGEEPLGQQLAPSQYLSNGSRHHVWSVAEDLRGNFKGSRGIALNDQNGDLFVCNSNESTIVKLPASSSPAYDFGASTQVAMRGRAEPEYITKGRRFLYSTRFSGDGFVSCASCHVDARSDQQAWLLTPDPLLTHPFPYDVDSDGLEGDPEGFGFEFPLEKGHMVTQSLQGLANFEMNKVRMEAPEEFTPFTDALETTRHFPLLEFDMVSNAPYHWRGDKPSFLDFNEAFVNLQNMAANDADATLAPYERADVDAGLTVDEMEEFETYVMSIHYPPNPNQPVSRHYEETTEEWRGLQGFHEDRVFFRRDRTCATCHSLPEGSNNRPAEVFFNQTVPQSGIDGIDGFPILGRPQPLEPAAFRGFFQKSGLLEEVQGFSLCSGMSTTRSGDLGLGRNGFLANGGIDNFDTLTLRDIMDRVCTMMGIMPEDIVNAEEVTRFVYAMDWGVAPIVGRSFTIRRHMVGAIALDGSDPDALFSLLLEEAHQGNCDVVASFTLVKVGSNGVGNSYVYNPITGRFEGNGTSLSEQELRARVFELPFLGTLLAGAGLVPANTPEIWSYLNRVTVEAVPLGNGYEKARITRAPAIGSLPCPLQVGTSPNEAYEDIPTFSRVHPAIIPNGTNPRDPADSAVNRTLHWLRRGLPSSIFGDPNADDTDDEEYYAAWDTSRRLQFIAQTGEFPPGTVIEMYVHHQDPQLMGGAGMEGCNLVPDSCVTSEGPDACATKFEFPIFPTTNDGGGNVVWESAIELEPEVIYTLLLGGPYADTVADVWREPKEAMDPDYIFDLGWNQYWWRAVYTEGTDTITSPFVHAPMLYPDAGN